jgi:hypothetical protein
MTDLYVMLHAWAAKPFVWGEHDCALCLADWFEALHGRDPAAHLRGRYFDAQTCQRLCQWFTDPVAVIEGCLDTVRDHGGQFPQTDAPTRGDVAVVRVQAEGRVIPASAIWLGSAWGCKAPEGVTTLRASSVRPVAVWSIADA